MKGILFLLLVLGIGLTIYLVNNHLDGFQAELVIPKAGPPPPKIEDPSPFAPPSTSLLAPPPGQAASVNSKPYSDPALKKASSGAINNIYVTLQGFLKNEAPKMSEVSDPTVQLPLNTARADARRLEDELAVLKRNPGLESSVTEEDLFGIQANLAYLQKKWRLSANTVEGFDCGCKAWFTGVLEGFEDAPKIVPVTMEDLSSLSIKIGVEIVRLQASGTTDELTQGRIKTLTAIKSTVDDNISEVKKGNKKIEEVQLSKTDIDTFLPLMSNLNSPLPQLVKETGVNPIVQSLFETYAGGDAEGAKAAQAMFDKYAAHILKNVSMNINMKYTGEGEQEMAMNDLMASILVNSVEDSCHDDAPESSGHPGHFNAVIRDMGVALPGAGAAAGSAAAAKGAGSAAVGAGLPGTGAGPTAASPPPEPSFDWKSRAQQICDQVSARNLDPSDFGCIKDQNSVSDGYSWRGNVKLVCSRLQTHSDPGVRESCGCPPIAWSGWK